MLGKRKSPDFSDPHLPKRRHIEAWLDYADSPIAFVEPSELNIPPSPPSEMASTIPTPRTAINESSTSLVHSSAPSGALTANADPSRFRESLRLMNVLDADLEDVRLKRKPHNWDELQRVLTLDRSTPELLEDDMEDVQTLIKTANGETQMACSLGPYIVKTLAWVRKPFNMRILQDVLWTHAVSTLCH
jgi:hypothetical protein